MTNKFPVKNLIVAISDRLLILKFIFFCIAVFSIAALEIFGLGILVPFAASVITGSDEVSFFSFNFKISSELIFYIASFWALKSLIIIIANFYNAMFIQEVKTRLQSALLNKFILRNNRSIGSETGDLFTRITNDIQMISGQILTPFATACSEFLLICIILVIIAGVFPQGLGILVVCVAIAFLINQLTVVRISSKVGNKRKEYEGAWAIKLTGALFSRFEAVTYKVSHLLHADIAKFLEKSNVEAGKFYAINPITRSLLEFSAIIGLVLALSLGLRTELPADMLLFFMVGSVRMLPGSMKIGYAISSIKFASSVVLQISNILTLSDEYDQPDLIHKNKILILQNLRDPLSGKQKIEISKSGLSIILGESGVGKSTWLSVAAMQLSHAGWNVGLVLQESTILAGDIEYNVNFYRRGITNNQISSILKLLRLDKTTKFDAQNLSGGEKRRLMLARATVNSPQIILLDEPTAGLDKQTQKDVMQYIYELSRSSKVIMISHSDIDIEFADNVYDLKGDPNAK